MGRKQKVCDYSAPSQVIALYSYDPLKDEISNENISEFSMPSTDTQLPFERGDRFEVISKELDWWIFCRSIKTNKEGYIPTVSMAPLCVAATSGNSTDNPDTKKFIPCLDDAYFDLKYFPNAPESNVKKPCPENNANVLSTITFWWLNRIMMDGFKRPLTEADLWELHDSNKADTVQKLYQQEWEKEMEKMKNSPMIEETVKKKKKKKIKKKKKSMDKNTDKDEKEVLMNGHEKAQDTSQKDEEKEEDIIKRHRYKPSVTKSLWRSFGLTYILGSFFKLLHDILLFINPYLLGKIITFIQSKSEDTKWGYIYAVLLFVSVTAQSIVLHQYFQRAFITGLRVRSALLAAIYRKMLRLSITGRRQFDVGGMVNLMSVDTQKCHDLLTYLNMMWSGPFQVIVSLAFLYVLLGWSIVAGFIILLLLMPLNIWVSSVEKKLRTKLMSHKDGRSKLINEMLAGVKVLKLYAWEESFIAKVMGFRKHELNQLRKAMILKANYSFTLACAPFLVSLATFAVYVFAGNELTAEKAFVGISLFNVIRFPLFMMPIVVTNIMQYIVSIKRISNFLKGDEIDSSDITHIDNHTKAKHAVELNDATLTWLDPEKPVLQNLNLKIPHGSLTAIVGQVGTGKTSLLSSVLGEIHKVNGEVIVNGDVAYVSQQAWIQNKALRDNILFGKTFVKKKYDDIINACSLKSDLNILPMGDMTEIGEKGINLSGGQKQRVSLARAVYNNSDIYLLDDPLSAVDSHVGKHIFEHVIGKTGLLKNKTRLLVTHNLNFLPHADNIIVLKNNQISEIGSYDELVANKGDFAEFLNTYHTEQKEDQELEDTHTEIDEVKENPVHEPVDELLSIPDMSYEGLRQRSASTLDVLAAGISASSYSLFDGGEGCPSDEMAIQEMLDKHEEECKIGNAGNIIQEETTQTGRVKRSVFLSYATSIGGFIAFCMLFAGLSAEAMLIYSRVWLAEWSVQLNITDTKRDYYLGVYGGLGVGQAFLVLFTGYFLAFGSVRASRVLHDKLLKNVMYCPMLFFETTPIGRIVNRMSKDINVIDETLPHNTNSFVRTFATMLGTIFIISYSTPIFMAVLLPIALVYFLTQRFYVASSRQLKRIESVKRSPIYNHFFESINGASTIRAFKFTEKFIKENEKRIDIDQAAHFPAMTSNRWLAMRLEFCGNLITFFAALFCILQRDTISAGVAGLSISYALQVTQTLNWLVRMTSELETNIVSVERVKEYIDQPTEAPAILPNNRPSKDWPQHGCVEVDSYSVRYRPGLDLVLKSITCQAKPSEKIGIVGRTGAGKSSLALALFRILEAAEGKIIIDKIDVSTIGLRDLRSKLTIIPQDPVLFSGSLRFNLDPFDTFDDSAIWKALEVAHLKSFVLSNSDGLHYKVEEGGENLSVGQRQLVCLARALLRKTKILLLDEATAAVDMETDALIQETIRKEFKDCTILTIAHRLNTIMDYDRVLVLNNGVIAEFDTPTNLLTMKNGIFYSMAKDAGLVS